MTSPATRARLGLILITFDIITINNFAETGAGGGGRVGGKLTISDQIIGVVSRGGLPGAGGRSGPR